MFSLRNVVISSDEFLGTTLPSNEYFPPVGLSNAAMQFSRVVLPEPDGPRRIIRSPSLTSILTPSSAFTVPDTIS